MTKIRFKQGGIDAVILKDGQTMTIDIHSKGQDLQEVLFSRHEGNEIITTTAIYQMHFHPSIDPINISIEAMGD